ncbi:MAG: hypothetical protein GC180_02735 [Bacteroidetes bacterium]|nr:hypothetical protein [Bacteroidota bacterium]
MTRNRWTSLPRNYWITLRGNSSQYTQEELRRIDYLASKNKDIRFTGQDLGLTNRQVTNWNKEGMFIEPLIVGKRKEFDFVEGIWVRLAMELQDYGFSFEEIKVYKDELCRNDFMTLIDKIEKGEITRDQPELSGIEKIEVDGREQDIDYYFQPAWREYYRSINQENPHVMLNLFTHVIHAALREDNYQIAFAHGGLMRFDWAYLIERKNEKGESENISRNRTVWKDLLTDTALIVSLDHVITSLILTKPKYKKNPRPVNFFLSDKEIEIIELLREHKDCKTFEIKVDNHQPVRIEITKQLPLVKLETQLATLIRKNRFGEINFKVQNGNLNHADEVISIMLSKNQE